MTLALPDDWTHEEVLFVRCLVDSGTHSIVSLPEYVAGLIAGGWLDPWRDGNFHYITFTPRGAAALGLTLDGDPARWMTVAESRALRERPGRSGGRLVLETDLAAARERAGLDRHVVGDAEENRRIGQGDGWRARQDGGLAKPIVLLGVGVDWNGPHRWSCPVCGPQEGPKAGEYCLKCDRHWQDRPKAGRGAEGGVIRHPSRRTTRGA